MGIMSINEGGTMKIDKSGGSIAAVCCMVVSGLGWAGPVHAIDLLPPGTEFVVSANVIPKQMNDKVPTTTPPATVDESAYFYRLAVQWPTDPSVIGVSKKAYYALVKGKVVEDVKDDYVESSDYVAVIYGHRYYLFADQRGLNLGWYAGASSWNSKGFDYDGRQRFAGYSESGVSAIVAAELSYDLRIPIGGNDLWVNPAIAVSVDKDYGTIKAWPFIEIGMVFK